MKRIPILLLLLMPACTLSSVDIHTPPVVTASATHEQLRIEVRGFPPAFKTQALDLKQIEYLRCWVRGADISDKVWNKEGFVKVNGNPDATLSIAGVPKGKNRVVSAQGYDINKNPIPGALLKAVYNSSLDKQIVTVYLKWRFVPLGETIEYLLDKGDPVVNTVNIDALQQLIDQVIYENGDTQNNLKTHPSRLSPQQIAQWLHNQNGVLPQKEAIQPANTDILVSPQNPSGGNLITDVQLVATDPSSQSMLLPAGNNSAILKALTPGTWQLKLSMIGPKGDVQATYPLSVMPDGSAVINQGNPVVPPPLISTLSVTAPPMPPGLVSWWTADDTDTDRLGINQGNFVANSYTAGVKNKGFQMDGSGSVTIADTPSLRPAKVTLEVWVKPEESGVMTTIATKEPLNASTQSGYGFRQRSNDRFWFVVGKEGAGSVAESNTVLQLGQWYHLVGTYDDTQLKLYVNGNLEKTTAAIKTIDSTAPLMIGRLNSGAGFFKGTLDEVRVFNQVLDSTQIQQLYQQQTLTITGDSFDSIAENNTVALGTLNPTVVAATNTSLTVALPPLLNGQKTIQVTTGTQTGNQTSITLSAPPNGSTMTQPGKTCYTLKMDDPNAIDGLYWIDPDGSGAFQVYCDMTTDGGGWTKVNSALHPNLFTAGDWDNLNPNAPMADMYSILNKRNLFKNGNTYTWRYAVGNAGNWLSPRAHTTVWLQEHDPFTQTTNGSDYIFVSGEASTTCGGFNGLHHKIQTGIIWSMASDVDSNDGVGCWWQQAVPRKLYSDVAPGWIGYLEGFGGNNVHFWQTLWLR